MLRFNRDLWDEAIVLEAAISDAGRRPPPLPPKHRGMGRFTTGARIFDIHT